ncbi:MAG TPA: hypothetical protein VK619_09800 [Pyrinomonadaceae bacterium]|nr:hypothetical protein [Pyrinomonadaceae bacterium]
MKRTALLLIFALLTFLVGVSADYVYNLDYYEARARYIQYRRAHPNYYPAYAVADTVLTISSEERQPRCK